MSSKKVYEGELQERLRTLSLRTNCPTRQENGQRYLGPPINWNEKQPSNAEVFISKLPSDCYEDEIYDFCSKFGKIYLIRLMINFENENRGFCFVTFSTSKEATNAVSMLLQTPLRKGHYVHAEISLNNCTLKMYGLDFGWSDEDLEEEIRTNAKDVVNVTIKRNIAQRTLMATLHFDTHQKAAIARRKLSQIANSRWGQNVKVFLWSKKLQNKAGNKQEEYGGEKFARKKSIEKVENVISAESNDEKKDIEFTTNKYTAKEDNAVFGDKSTKDLTSHFQHWLPFSATSPKCSDSSAYGLDSFLTNRDTLKPNQQFHNYDFNGNICSESDSTNIKNTSALGALGPFSPSKIIQPVNPYGSPLQITSFNNYYTDSLYPSSSETSPGGNSQTSFSSETDGSFFGHGCKTWSYEASPQCEKPLNYFSDINSIGSLDLPEHQIELILKEALETMTQSHLNAYW